MIIKQSLFSHQNEVGITAVPLFGAADSYFEKTAAASLMPEVANYIAGLTPVQTSQYVLVNALGASEYFGSNVNGDAFTESSLIHRPDGWSGVPAIDKVRSADWPYGFPTFYTAHPFAHHRNKDPNLAFGEVELSTWNPHMHRVELVTRLDHDKCQQFGGTGVWDRLKMGGFPDVSMGSKVPFDTCSICLDWKRYKDALATFDPKRHKHPGQAVLEVHKKDPIRGVSITRKDYCQHALQQMNRILPDGRKVFVYNDFPKFFDISFVFIGADRTAKTMLFIFSGGKQLQVTPSAAEDSGGGDGEKTAAIATFEQLRDWVDGEKAGEITKERMPDNLAGKAVPLLTRNESDIPTSTLSGLSALPLSQVLSTLCALGILLRPREFQQLALQRAGESELANQLHVAGEVFPQASESSPVGLGPEHFLPALLPLLLPLLSMRSGLGPVVEHRVTLLASKGDGVAEKKTASRRGDLLHKVACAYNGYREGFMELVPHAQDLLARSSVADDRLSKIAAAPVENVFTPLAAHYFQDAFLDEVGDSKSRVVKE